MLVPIIICIVAVLVLGVPFTYYWFRWSDKNAVGSDKRFADKPAKKTKEVRVIKSDTTGDTGGGR